ncbi:DUF4253 domain-containing protein [Massilia sp. CF038]|uniref:DUF4253 domain-containing protein n=1 Tax=Massilia sp. CF038 TaxID=1881045 RepID=UPI00090FA597|nr:DUF4253 domain-containing protein [Massilia sp. CF038]SHH19672.1 protein of unknown function [Massilia sp. CF038]
MSFPFKIHQVAGSEALAEFSALQKAGGGHPVILGDADSFDRIKEAYEGNADQSAEELIAVARTIDPANWFVQRQAEDPEYYDMEEDEWPGEESANDHGLSSHRDVLTGQPYPVVNIAVIPAPYVWMVPCYLRIGGWNECPDAPVHAALFKYWGEKYGATVACVTSDVIEMQVTKPPTSKEAALELAKEQYLYCPDIVDQGTESIEALAAGLIDSKVWFFWWD